MDNITHALTGVVFAHAFLKRRLGPETLLIMAVAANLPDVDVAAHLGGERTDVLLRRSFGHSIFAFPAWSAIASLFWKWKYPKFSLKTLFGLCLLGCVIHVFFDLVNSFGVVLLWPLNLWRPEFAIIFIIDLILAGILAAPLILSLFKKLRPKLEFMARTTAALTVLYVLFCFTNRQLALNALKREAAMNTDFQYVFAEPLGPHRWHGVLRDGLLYKNYLIHSLTGNRELKSAVKTHLDHSSVDAVRRTELGRRLEWFFKAPVWKVEKGDGYDTVEVYDLRFQSTLLNRGTPFSFAFKVLPGGQVVFLR